MNLYLYCEDVGQLLPPKGGRLRRNPQASMLTSLSTRRDALYYVTGEYIGTLECRPSSKLCGGWLNKYTELS